MNAAHRAGMKYGKKLAGGFTPNPNQAFREGSASYLWDNGGRYNLETAVSARRDFEAGARAGYMEVIGKEFAQ